MLKYAVKLNWKIICIRSTIFRILCCIHIAACSTRCPWFYIRRYSHKHWVHWFYWIHSILRPFWICKIIWNSTITPNSQYYFLISILNHYTKRLNNISADIHWNTNRVLGCVPYISRFSTKVTSIIKNIFY